MKMKLLALNYQRNGIFGEGFFVAHVKDIKDTKGEFIITFDVNDSIIDNSTCRAVMIAGRDNPIYECWRGDYISYDLNKLLNELVLKNKVRDIYSLHTLYENKALKQKLPVEYAKATI